MNIFQRFNISEHAHDDRIEPHNSSINLIFQLQLYLSIILLIVRSLLYSFNALFIPRSKPPFRNDWCELHMPPVKRTEKTIGHWQSLWPSSIRDKTWRCGYIVLYGFNYKMYIAYYSIPYVTMTIIILLTQLLNYQLTNCM